MKWAFIRTFAAGGSAVIVGLFWAFLVETFDWHGAMWVFSVVLAVVVAVVVSGYMDRLGPEEGMGGRQVGGESQQERSD